MRVDCDQPSTGRERTCQRRDHTARLELQRRPRAIGLRGNDQVVLRLGEATTRADLVEQETMIFPIDHQNDWLFVDWIAAGAADPRPPVLREERAKLSNLGFELVRSVAGQRKLVPDEAGGRV